MTKLGVDKLKILLTFGFSLGEQFETAMKDGKFTLMDLPGFVDEFMGVQGVIEAGPVALKQALDLTSEERLEINEWAQDEFDVANDEVEAKVEAALDGAVSILMLYNAFKPKGTTDGK